MNRITISVLAAAALAGGVWYFGTRPSPHVATASIPAAAAIPGARPTLAAVIAETDPVQHRAKFMQWLTGLTAEETAFHAPQLWALPGDVNEVTERKKLFAYAWGQRDGVAALEFARTQPGAGKVAAIGAALAGWASRDPEAAKAWIAARLDPREQLMYSWALIEGWARKDPAAATAYALSLKERPNAGRFIQTIALEQVRRDAPAAGAWALSLPEGSSREAAVLEIATQWSRSSPQAAADWARNLPGTGLAIPALKNAAAEWARQDPAAAGAWLNQLPPSKLRDQAVASYCQVLAMQNLASISQWAQTITDTSLREQSLVRIGEEWMGRNPTTTLAWLPNSGLSGAAMERLKQVAR